MRDQGQPREDEEGNHHRRRSRRQRCTYDATWHVSIGRRGRKGDGRYSPRQAALIEQLRQALRDVEATAKDEATRALARKHLKRSSRDAVDGGGGGGGEANRCASSCYESEAGVRVSFVRF